MKVKEVGERLIVSLTRLVHETPLGTTMKAGSSMSVGTQIFDSLNDPEVTLSESILSPVPILGVVVVSKRSCGLSNVQNIPWHL